MILVLAIDIDVWDGKLMENNLRLKRIWHGILNLREFAFSILE